MYDDLIQESFLDSYNNLTLKSVMMLKWINANCVGKGTEAHTRIQKNIEYDRIVDFHINVNHISVSKFVCIDFNVKINTFLSWLISYLGADFYNDKIGILKKLFDFLLISVNFFMKCDDDTFVNVPNLVHFLLGGTIPAYRATLHLYNQETVRTLSSKNRLMDYEDLLIGNRFCRSKPISDFRNKW